MFGVLGPALRLTPFDRGILGFQQGAAIDAGGMTLGRMDFGGESQRGWVRVDVPGKGCEWVRDWAALAEVESVASTELRRVDIALTSWRGEVTHERVVQAHADGRFVSGGRPPALQQIVSSDPLKGRTCYIGNREGDKVLRAYERGLKLVQDLPPALRSPDVRIDGALCTDIYRCELELKAQNRPIPWDVIERRDHYFAGAYPFCSDLLPEVDRDVLRGRPERVPQRVLAVALANCRLQYGRTLFTALKAYGGDFLTVWDQVVATEDNQALVEAGVLLVEHDPEDTGVSLGLSTVPH